MICKFHRTRPLVALGAAILTGCASIPADRGLREVRQLTADRGQTLPEGFDSDRTKLMAEILAQPLTESGAVRIAFVNNPRIQAEYARLGLTGADLIQAGRLSNPTLSASALGSSAAGAATRYDLGLSQNLAELLLLRVRMRFSRGEFERAKLDAAQSLLVLAADVQSAYYAAVGAEQVAQMRKTIATAASAAAELSNRFKEAGNHTALELAVNRAAESQAKLDEDQAELQAANAVSALNEVMGLSSNAQWRLATALPIPVQAEDPLDKLQNLASSKRLDLESDRRAVTLLEASFSVTRSYRFLGNIDVGAQYERDTDLNRLFGPSLSLQLPIFNQGQAPLLRAQARLDFARAELATKELEISNGVKRTYERLIAARKRIDRLRSETIPLREAIVARTQEQVNYMLVGVFDLLRVRQDEYTAYQQYLEAVRDYWQARVDLARNIGTRLPSDNAIGEASVVPHIPVEPTEGGTDHSQHVMPSQTPAGGPRKNRAPPLPSLPAPMPNYHKKTPSTDAAPTRTPAQHDHPQGDSR